MAPAAHFPIRQCRQDSCRFRFPVAEDRHLGQVCPRCGAPTRLVATVDTGDRRAGTDDPVAGPPVEALLDNVRSVYNVGSIFRTADGVGLRHLYLCGVTPTPDHPRLAKTALGAEGSVAWSQHNNGVDTAVSLRERGYRLWAVEGRAQAVPLFEATLQSGGEPVVLVVGNEKAGVDPGILAQCQRVLSLPMQGLKRSLNVTVAFGIAAYFVRHNLPNHN